MKKLISITLAVLGIVFLTSMKLNDESAWSSQKDSKISTPIPSSVMQIAERSCVECHTKGGKCKAMMYLNLSKWDKYSQKKQTKKASAICKMVTEDKMPPKGFREKNPDAVPTKDDVKIICDWANSIP